MGGSTSPGSVDEYGAAVPLEILLESSSIAKIVSFLVDSEDCIRTKGSIFSAFVNFPAMLRDKTSRTASANFALILFKTLRHIPSQRQQVPFTLNFRILLSPRSNLVPCCCKHLLNLSSIVDFPSSNDVLHSSCPAPFFPDLV